MCRDRETVTAQAASICPSHCCDVTDVLETVHELYIMFAVCLYLNAGSCYLSSIQAFHSKLGSFQHFILDTDIWLEIEE